jgi:pyruvate formate lyase activating enzyme
MTRREDNDQTVAVIERDLKGTIFDIQRFSLHDGPGIRTLVFLKGCPLSCRWCSNPESQSPAPQLGYVKWRCLSCHSCVKTCPSGALQPDPEGGVVICREKCSGCGACCEVCYPGALEMIGRQMSVHEVVDLVERDATFYRRSGGGVTFSGGEPLQQAAFLTAVLAACHERNLHTAIETTGFAAWETLRRVVRDTDLVLYDLKHLDSDVHQHFTGVPNDLILANVQRIVHERPTIIRIPLIPSFNVDMAHLESMAAFIVNLAGPPTVHLLPYHRLGEGKHSRLGSTYGFGDVDPPSDEELDATRSIFERAGLTVFIGG